MSYVTFYINGKIFTQDSISPYSFSFDTKTLTNGTHNISAIATDSSGNHSLSHNIYITVKNLVPDTQPPTVQIISPIEGEYIKPGTTIVVDVSAQDNVAVSYVEVYVDGLRICRDTSPPYGCNYTIPKGKAKMQIIKATATDSSGLNNSHSISINSSSSDSGGEKGGGKGRK